MQKDNTVSIIENAVSVVDANSPLITDGQWLEELTVAAGPFIKEWDIVKCYSWADWPVREQRFPRTTKQDIGIDAVAVRRSDGEHIAIQCKSRQLNANGQGAPIHKGEIDKFTSTSAGDFWAERWIVTNGDNPISDNTQQALSMTDKPIKIVNISNDLLQQQSSFTYEECPHCSLGSEEGNRQTRTCMQSEAVRESVRILKDHEYSNSGGLPIGQARGKIILPCGTGKTRISLRLVEELTQQSELSIVLCPSIALVAQIRREYLQHAEKDIRALAVCSDETAGYSPKKEGVANTAQDPTVDNSNVSASEVKGKVTTDSAEIAQWIRQGVDEGRISVIFGTYQSGHRITDALKDAGATVSVLIADEAHRTAGLRRKRGSKKRAMSEEEQRIRDFTLCHDNNAFPAKYRVYQTATPRIYDTRKVDEDKPSDWMVRSMDDETVFGVELYRKSYMEAVKNGWLSDYRIIALGINDPDSYAEANQLASKTRSKGRRKLTSSDYLRGLAFALSMGGATQDREDSNVSIKSCIAFMNTVDKSKNMTEDLQSESVRKWIQKWLHKNMGNRDAANYTLEHLDATSNVTARENAKRRLALASEEKPHGIINVGIFGEGTDSPSLNAVAFLEPRKSPIDVIQAVGRAMRAAPGKELGYIICPILIPPNADPEQWLSVSDMDEGWQELGQILLALRAHDQRIEDNLADLLQLYIPKPPEVQRTIVAIADSKKKHIRYGEHEGPPGEAQRAIERILQGQSTATPDVHRIGEEKQPAYQTDEPTQIITGKKSDDGSIELRLGSVARTEAKADGSPGRVDIEKSKVKAKDMVNKGEGMRLAAGDKNKARRRTQEEMREHAAQQMLLLSGMDEYGNAIKMNLLSKSGLVDNRVVRDLNILEVCVKEAAHHMRSDRLQPTLDRHFGLDNLKEENLKKQADGCVIAALLIMNAAMLHQRIRNGRWLQGIGDLSNIKNDVDVVQKTCREWERIMRHDFRPVLEPALEAIYAAEETGKTAGMERALRHIAAEAERIAETYADMGSDHAGPLFNRVMGNQASDGAYFTRPPAASIAARLALDVCGDADWTSPQVWREHKTVDLACGSGTLLAAVLTEMKRRARERGASDDDLVALQKLAVEDTIKGLDINPVSLQLAASQLTTGNQEIRYRQMGLHMMPYGPSPDNTARIFVGAPELLGQKAIVPRDNELNLPDDKIGSQAVWNQPDDAELEDAVEAVKDARIVIMNPPFTNRAKMGEKFPSEIQRAIRSRVDGMEQILVRNDRDMEGFMDKNSLGPLFVALADRCVEATDGILTMVNPTIALTNPSGQDERRILAQRYHIHTVLTCHQPGQGNLSQNTSINESIIVATRCQGPKPPTRFINLDRMPIDENEVADFHRCLAECPAGLIANGWGEVSEWPTERIEAGDWTAAIWRSTELAEAAAYFAGHKQLIAIGEFGLSPAATGQILRGSFERAEYGLPGSFPILKSKGTDGQMRIQSTPDEHWIPKQRDEEVRKLNGGTYPAADKILRKAGYLLITAGQDSSTARLTATADDKAYVGNSWMPVGNLSPKEAKAAAVFINSTAGRLQIMRNPGRKLTFPTYSAAEASNIKIPDIKDRRIREMLVHCWERTKDMEVPQFRDGECEVRRLWDEAVAEAMGWDRNELARLRELLNNEPHVRGLGYNQYANEIEEADEEWSPDETIPAREEFEKLADEWLQNRPLGVDVAQMTRHPAYQEIISMGEPAIPWILQRLINKPDHWFVALYSITGANPVPPESKGRVREMATVWIEWGRQQGYGAFPDVD